MNILVTAAITAEAHRLKTKLNTEPILLGDYFELPAFMISSGKMIRLPNPDSVAYTHEMLTLCLDNHVQSIYVLREEEAKLLLEAKQLFKEYNIDIVINCDET
jgi:hypothetical protein